MSHFAIGLSLPKILREKTGIEGINNSFINNQGILKIPGKIQLVVGVSNFKDYLSEYLGKSIKLKPIKVNSCINNYLPNNALMVPNNQNKTLSLSVICSKMNFLVCAGFVWKTLMYQNRPSERSLYVHKLTYKMCYYCIRSQKVHKISEHLN